MDQRSHRSHLWTRRRLWWLVTKVLGKYVFLVKYLSLGRCSMGTDGLKYCCEDPLLGGSWVRGKLLGPARAAAATTSGKIATGVFLSPLLRLQPATVAAALVGVALTERVPLRLGLSL